MLKDLQNMALCIALSRTRTCDLLIRRGTLRLFIGPAASCLAHNNGCFAWPLAPVDPSEPARIPSRRWYRRWYGKCHFGDSLLVRKRLVGPDSISLSATASAVLERS